MVTLFKYLERVLTAAYENWMLVVAKLWKARKIWTWLVRILVREGSSPRV